MFVDGESCVSTSACLCRLPCALGIVQSRHSCSNGRTCGAIAVRRQGRASSDSLDAMSCAILLRVRERGFRLFAL